MNNLQFFQLVFKNACFIFPFTDVTISEPSDTANVSV